MSLFAQKSRPEMVATIYGSSQAQLSERLGMICAATRGWFTTDIKKPDRSQALLIGVTNHLVLVIASYDRSHARPAIRARSAAAAYSPAALSDSISNWANISEAMALAELVATAEESLLVSLSAS